MTVNVKNLWKNLIMIKEVKMVRLEDVKNVKVKEIKKNKDFVDSFVGAISQLDFAKFEEHLTKLDESSNISYIKEAQKKVESFIESLNKTKYGLRKTEN